MFLLFVERFHHFDLTFIQHFMFSVSRFYNSNYQKEKSVNHVSKANPISS